MSGQYPPAGPPEPDPNRPQGYGQHPGYSQPTDYGQPGSGGQHGYGGQPGSGVQSGIGGPPGYGSRATFQQTPGYLAGAGGPPGPYRGPEQPQPSKKNSNTRLIVLVGVGVLALILLGVVGGVIVFRVNEAAKRPGGTPSSAVQAFLDGLADGRSATVLGFMADPPADTTFFSDAVLRDSKDRAPLTAITVPDVDDNQSGSARVEASFMIGRESVSQIFSLTKRDDTWKVLDPYVDADLSGVTVEGLPMLINDVEVDATTVALLPGSYKFTTGLKAIDYGKSDVLTVTDVGVPIEVSDLSPSLTRTGEKAFVAAAQASLKDCLAQQKLDPKGCPQTITAGPGHKIDVSSIRWSVTDDSWDSFEPTLDDTSPTVVTGEIRFKFTFAATGTFNGKSTTFNNNEWAMWWRDCTVSADLTKQPLQVSWVRNYA
jgi:hypothetical protein